MNETRRVPDIDHYAMIDYFGSREFNDGAEETRYREFKTRLLAEVVARERSPHTAMWIEQELHDKTRSEI